MNNNWKQTLRDKLEGYETVAPEGLLDEVMKRVAAPETPALTHRGKAMLWIRRAAIPAAIVAGMIAWYALWPEKENIHPIDTPNIATLTEEHALASADDQTEREELSAATQKVAIAKVQSSRRAEAQTSITTIQETETQVEDANAPDEVKTTEETQSDTSHTVPPIPNRTESVLLAHHKRLEEMNPIRTKKRRRVSVGFAVSGLLAHNQNMQVEDASSSPSHGDGDGNNQDNPGTTIDNPDIDSTDSADSTRTRSRAKRYDKNREIKHLQPIKIGLSVAYPLSERWTVETGLTYCLQRSNITYYNNGKKTTERQTLHFVGIPLNLSYRVWTSRSWTTYLAAGGAFEKELSEARPWWSLDAKVGLSYNLGHRLQVYLEPGAAYYFDNHSDVVTLYNESPWNFELKVGLRWNLRKK